MILVGLSTMLFWAVLLWAGIDAYKRPLVYALITVSAGVALAGGLIWPLEGRRSVYKQRSLHERRFSQWLKIKTFKLEDDTWSVTCEGAEDRRTVASLRVLNESKGTITLLTDTAHVLPKRVFDLHELRTVRSLCSNLGSTTIIDEVGPGVSLSPWDFVAGSFEYYRWRHKAFIVLFILLPLLVLGTAILDKQVWPQNEVSAPNSNIGFIVIAITIWYLSFPFYEISKGFMKYRRASLDCLNQNEFTIRIDDRKYHARWEQSFIGREGWGCFLFELERGYFVIPKRVLSPEKLAIVRTKLAAGVSANLIQP
jgi:hypothetical protein